ncbi:MAG: hypothetical protein WED15_10265 [Akkermansiaceae bacterium]
MSLHKTHAFPARRRAPAHGFALVVTLSLMILLTIVAVGLLTLSSISLRSSSQETAMATARANARLALMLALGDLQKQAGPDQRITTRAEILDSSPATSLPDDVSQPLWTGTWKTHNPAPAANNQLDSGAPPTLRSWSTSQGAQWLVSNPTPATPLDPITWTGAYPSAVTLAKGLGSDALDVAVPLVRVASGRYGYWVADEGLKARINLVDPTLGVAAATHAGQAHFLAPQANAAHKITGLVDSPANDFRSYNSPAQLAKTLSSHSVKLLPSSPDNLNLKTFLPDITTTSRGVLADVKHGGLKKDLTAAFETSAGYDALNARFGHDKKCVFRNLPGITVPYTTAMQGLGAETYEGITDALPWAVLYSYYNIYKDTMPAPSGITANSTVNPQTSGSLSSLPYSVTPRVITVSTPVTGGVAVGKYGGLVPEVLAQRTDIALESYLSDGMYKLRLRYYPQLILYNPYNCRIALPGFRFTRNYYSFSNHFSEYKIQVLVNGESIAPAGTAPANSYIYINQPKPGSAHRYSTGTAPGACDSMEPGETRVFNLGQDVDKNVGAVTTINGETIEGKGLLQAIHCTSLISGPSASSDRSLYVDLPVNTTRVLEPNNQVGFINGETYAGTPIGTDKVEVFLSPTGKLTSGAADTFITPDHKWPSARGGRIFSTQGPSVTYDATDWPAGGVNVSSMVDNPYMVAGFFIRKKGINPSSSAKLYKNAAAIIPPYHGNAPYFTPVENIDGYIWHELYLNQFGKPYANSASDVQLMEGTGGETFIGERSVGDPFSGSTPPRIVLRDVPNQPLLSLGQFMHMPTMIFATDNSAMAAYARFGSRDTGAMYIGGSLASPFIPTTSNLLVNTVSSSHPYMIMDDSFLANDALFDRFFFSTVPPASLNANAPQQWRDFNSANAGATTLEPASPPLPNSRIKPFGSHGGLPLLEDLRDFDKAAANLMQDGAFNVNSTSINAWKALLSSLSGNDMRVYKAADGTAATLASAALKNPIPRFWSSSAGNINQPWDGNRTLSDDEITELATRIVEQVKLRGPFLSMADFLNRRLGPANTANGLSRVGCLQAAIDRTSPDINQAAKDAGQPVSTGLGLGMNRVIGAGLAVIDANLQDGADRPLNSAVGIPGYLMQQDIVQAFSPAMTVRSDTFVIRTYGECVSPSGAVQAKAWAEAVVQRVPEYLESSADPNPETALDSLTSTINQTLGRRFEVVGFRWLSSDEI